MTSAGLGAPAASARVDESAPHAQQVERVTAAWLSAIPCAGLVALAAWLLGPPLGELMSAGASGYTFTPEYVRVVRPEPTEHARYLIALTLPLAISLAVCMSPRWLSQVPLRAARRAS